MENKIYEVNVSGSDAFYVVAADKYRALELIGDYLRESKLQERLKLGGYDVRQVDTSREQILRPEKCHECPMNE